MRKAHLYLPLLGGLLLAGCDDETEPTPTIEVSVAGAVTVVQGQSGTTTINVTRGGEYDDEVALSVSGLPVGVTATLAPEMIPAGSGAGTSTLTLTAAADAALGTASFTVEADAIGATNLVATATGSVTVTAAPNFTLAVDPAELSIAAGASGTSNVVLTRVGGYAGAVTLTVANLPTGVTAGFDNGAPTANAAVLTLTADVTAAAGTSTITVTGTGDPGVRSADLVLTITPPPGDFEIVVDPAALTVAPGQTGTAAVTINKTGSFTGLVTLTATGAPDGVTVEFDPAQASPRAQATRDETTSSTLTVTVGAEVADGEYPIVIHGNAEDQDESTATLTLTVTAEPADGFSIALDPVALTVAAGESGTSTVTVSKTGTFTGNVALSVVDLPTGITAGFDPVAASAGRTSAAAKDVQTTSVLTLTVDPTVAAADYPLTVRGTFEGQPDSDATLTLTVSPAPGAFSLEVLPPTINLQAGGTGTATVNINKTGDFTDLVTLTAVGLPAGITASFDPPEASAPRSSARRDVQTTSTLTLTAEAGVAPAAYEFAVHGNAEGQDEQMVTVTANVSAAPGGGNTSFKFCNLDDLPVWFAYQDGAGAWTAVTGGVAGDGTTYSFEISQATGGVAWVTGDAVEGFSTAVFYGTQAELIANGTAQCGQTPDAGRTLNGSVAGIELTDQVSITMGGGSATALGALPTFQLSGVRNGPADLFATHTTVETGPPIAVTPVKMIIRRNLDIPNNGTIDVLDFGAGEAFDPQTALITFTNLGGDTPVAFLGYQTPTTSGALYTSFGGSGETQTVYGVPAAEQEADDLHFLTVLANSATDGDARGHFAWFKTIADRSVAIGPVLNAPVVTSLGAAPYPRYQAAGTIQAEYDDSFVFALTQAAASARGWTITASRGYFGSAPDYTLAIPDLSPAGFQALWALQPGTVVQLSTGAFGFSSGSTLPNVEGGTADFATRGGQVTP